MTKIVDSYTPPDIHELLKVYEPGFLPALHYHLSLPCVGLAIMCWQN